MPGMYVSAAIALVVAGAAIGILVMVCLGIKRDDRPGGFPAAAKDRTARAARKMTGAGARPEPPPRPAASRTSCRCSRPADAEAPQAGPGRAGRCPAPRSSNCSPARTSASASGPSGGCSTSY